MTEELFLNTVMDCFMSHVEIPTRGNNTLDLILSSDSNRVTDIEDCEMLGSSDHIIISYNIQVQKKQ